MASKSSSSKFDLNESFKDFQAQFQGLDPKEPGQWPLAPKITVGIVVMIAVVVLGWFALLSDEDTKLEDERAREPALKTDFTSKLGQAVNLPELLKQKQQVEEYVTQLDRQLPGKAEMDALLSDINQAGIGRGLQVELFRPGAEVVKDYYAERPITIRVVGRYHDIGAFTADVSNLSRIVTLHGLVLTAPTGKDVQGGNLSLDATARTYRYLDPTEVMEQKKTKAKSKEQNK
ncbi:MAG: type 4a pilus biogenesis protein PilO [Paucibacter sp.]|nr:type 4a pilus biogenesis protein PilO [Roseateles sp.]